MALQYTYLAHASPCAWVEKGHNFVIQFSVSAPIWHYGDKGLQPDRPGHKNRACISPWEAWNLCSLSLPDKFMKEKKRVE